MPTDVNLLNDGVTIVGAESYAQIGVSVSSAGDFNNDGIEDFLFTGPLTDLVNQGRGATYLIFGKTGGVGAIDLGNLTADQGFAIYGREGGGVDMVASSAGDINGDGYDDVIIGAPRDAENGHFSGRAYVVYGHGGSVADVDLTTPVAGQTSTIFMSPPASTGGDGPFLGVSVSSVGDVNADGYDDVLIAAENDATGGAYAGRAFLLFGSADGIGTLNLATLTAAQGITFTGTQASGFAAHDVSGLGDINGDGIDDFAIASPYQNGNAGSVHVFFGKGSGLHSTTLGSIPASDGFVIVGNGFSGGSVSGAGDVNGDGFEDIILSNAYGSTSAYVIYGKATGFGTVNLNTLTAAEGFAIAQGAAAGSYGGAVAGAGDVNGDGFDDVLVGVISDNVSTTYLIYGSATPGNTALGTADGINFASGVSQDSLGFALDGADINGDGFSDVMIGAWRSNNGGYAIGATYLYYATQPTGAVTRTGTVASQNLAGGNGGDTLNGMVGDDHLFGNGGADTLNGGEDDDTLDGGAGADTMDGGTGDDVFIVNHAGDLVFEAPGEGNDRVIASVSWEMTAGQEIETLVTHDAAGTAAINFWGNELANRIEGNAGSNIFFGGGGNDVLEGNAGNDSLYGGDANDTLFGGEGNDNLRGDAGDDVMDGGAGDDQYWVLDAGDQVIELADGGYDRVDTTLASYTLSANVERLAFNGSGTFTATGNDGDNSISASSSGAYADVLKGMGGDDYLRSFGGNDRLEGGEGNDDLDGGVGRDTLIGGAGNDHYEVDDALDVVTELAGEGSSDEVRASINAYTLTANVENLVFTGTGAFTGTGNGEANTITLNINATASTLKGMGGDDRLYAGGGNDMLDGGTGVDAMRGGAGDDVYIVDNIADAANESTGEGTDTVLSSVSFTLGYNVENLTLTGSASINGTGNDLANVLIGNNGHNILDGGYGADRMEGGSGNDTYYVDNANDAIIDSSGTDIARTSVSYTLGAGAAVETLTTTNDAGTGAINLVGNDLVNRIVGNAGANVLSGGGGNDRLEGGAGNDTLDGGTGADLMIGGTGDDLYKVDDAGDVITEATGAGLDTVNTAIAAYTLSNYVEKLVYTGTAAFAGTGGATDNEIVGGNGADTLLGMAGNDTLIGGAGIDRLEGGAGNDRLDGGAGIDVMIGGTGNDVYFVTNPAETVTELANEGVDRVNTQLSAYTLGANLENLTYTGTGTFTGNGNELDNMLDAFGTSANTVLRGLAGNDLLQGGWGNDQLDGGEGVDALYGGWGDDIYTVDRAGDTAIEWENAGTDTVRSTASYTLGVYVENLTLIGGASSSATGNALDNVLIGNGGHNTLDGGLGADRMEGGGGDDIYKVDNAGDVVIDTAGVDTVMASVSYTLGAGVAVETLSTNATVGTAAIDLTGNNLVNRIVGNAGSNALSGAGGNDRLEGMNGDDRLDGGTGNDLLIGGAGADTFVFSTAPGGNVDVVDDFVRGTDRIELDGSVFAGLGAGQLATDAFGTGTAATTAEQRIVYDAATGNLWYDADGTGAAAATLFATLQTRPADLDASDFAVTGAAALSIGASGWLQLAPELDAPQDHWTFG